MPAGTPGRSLAPGPCYSAAESHAESTLPRATGPHTPIRSSWCEGRGLTRPLSNGMSGTTPWSPEAGPVHMRQTATRACSMRRRQPSAPRLEEPAPSTTRVGTSSLPSRDSPPGARSRTLRAVVVPLEHPRRQTSPPGHPTPSCRSAPAQHGLAGSHPTGTSSTLRDRADVREVPRRQCAICLWKSTRSSAAAAAAAAQPWQRCRQWHRAETPAARPCASGSGSGYAEAVARAPGCTWQSTSTAPTMLSHSQVCVPASRLRRPKRATKESI